VRHSGCDSFACDSYAAWRRQHALCSWNAAMAVVLALCLKTALDEAVNDAQCQAWSRW
jgi:hypothetical protein